MTIKYENPPINEVIIGAYFDQPIMQLHSQHVGLLWAQLRDRFPIMQQQPELPTPLIGQSISFQLAMSDEPYPMPRFWLISTDETLVIQIQKNAFIFNWRKRSGDYPHFENVKAKFDEYFDEFSTFIKSEFSIESINVKICELTYSNVINKDNNLISISDAGVVLNEFSIPDVKIHNASISDFNQVYVYRIEPDLSLNISFRSGRKADDSSHQALVLELRCLGPNATGSLDDANGWYARAHDFIGHCFNSITTTHMQTSAWKPK
ncbi:MAG: TIGR04255 family protein [Methylocystis sp.]|nr:TIGR04255 family protein [Methylocystis sp.]MCA3584373.1 TIGR04255 family protein [Methylocystis sp.]MCA3587400.1 TIGR04255 family protein [Methylocystis sp.]MCA3592606.1 TIGR04255 family protein [Methylocystis sp.]